jgi:hypothetical protein
VPWRWCRAHAPLEVCQAPGFIRWIFNLGKNYGDNVKTINKDNSVLWAWRHQPKRIKGSLT